jgi:hypothetical protein
MYTNRDFVRAALLDGEKAIKGVVRWCVDHGGTWMDEVIVGPILNQLKKNGEVECNGTIWKATDDMEEPKEDQPPLGVERFSHPIESAKAIVAPVDSPKPSYTLASGYVVNLTPSKTKKLTRAEIYGKWNEIAALVLALKEGDSTEIDVFPGVPPERFRDNARAALCSRSDTKGILWHVRLHGGVSRTIVIKRGPAKGDRETPGVRTEIHERIEETKTTHRLTVEERGAEDIDAVTGTADNALPVPLADAARAIITPETVSEMKELAAPLPVTVPAVVAPQERSLSRKFLANHDERASGKELIEHVVHMFDPHTEEVDDGECENNWDKLNSLAERVKAERDASLLADQYMQLIEIESNEKLSDAAYAATWDLMHCLLSEKRLLEYEVFRYVKDLRQHGDPARADVVAELLPEEDLDKLKRPADSESGGPPTSRKA